MATEIKRTEREDAKRSLMRLQASVPDFQDASSLRYQASVVRTRLAKIEEEARELRIDLDFLEALEAGLGQAAKQTIKVAAKKGPSKSESKPKAAAAKSAPESTQKPVNGAPLEHREKFPALTPKRRAERAKAVLAAAREYVKTNGPEVKVKTLADFVAGKGIDMNVPQDRMSTAVGNIMFHNKSEFVRIADGLYRHSGKGLNGHARS